MKKIFFFFISITIILILITFSLKDKLIINTILENIEKEIGISVELKDNQKWDFYPKISYQNNLSINNINNNLIIKNSKINIKKNYWFNSLFIINFKSPSIKYKGVDFRNSEIESVYKNKTIILNKFNTNIIDGNLNLNGRLNLFGNKKISLNGSYDNISLNRILKQINISNWERVKIKISSSNFKINSINGSMKQIIKNLNGDMNISGSIFFVSTEEERFGAAFLSILADKIADMMSLSKSISYLLEKFADLPSNISGKIKINEGILITKNMLINNSKGKALLTGSLDLNTKIIDGKIDLYKNNMIFLTVDLKGNIENPQILVGGKVLVNNQNNKSQNIKEIFEEGIQSLVDNILKLND